jgi:hypothetical protein
MPRKKTIAVPMQEEDRQIASALARSLEVLARRYPTSGVLAAAATLVDQFAESSIDYGKRQVRGAAPNVGQRVAQAWEDVTKNHPNEVVGDEAHAIFAKALR